MGVPLRPDLPEAGLRAFLTTATTGSYAATDRTYGWTATTAYRRCAEVENVLEHHLNLTSATLFRQNPDTRRLETTALGDALVPLARAYLSTNNTVWEVLETFVAAHQTGRQRRSRTMNPRTTPARTAAPRLDSA